MTTVYSAESTSKANAFLAGATIKKAYGKIVTNATTAVGDLLVMAQRISPDSIIHSIKIDNTEAGTGLLADIDIVIRNADDLSKPKTDDVLLADGFSLASARTTMTEVLGSSISNFDKSKSLGQLLELGSDSIRGYLSLVMLVNDAGTAATTINYEIEYSSPQ